MLLIEFVFVDQYQVELENQCADYLAECEKIKARVAKLSDAVEDARASFDAAKAEVDEKRAALRECDDALKSIVKEKQRLVRCCGCCMRLSVVFSSSFSARPRHILLIALWVRAFFKEPPNDKLCRRGEKT